MLLQKVCAVYRMSATWSAYENVQHPMAWTQEKKKKKKSLFTADTLARPATPCGLPFTLETYTANKKQIRIVDTSWLEVSRGGGWGQYAPPKRWPKRRPNETEDDGPGRSTDYIALLKALINTLHLILGNWIVVSISWKTVTSNQSKVNSSPQNTIFPIASLHVWSFPFSNP